MGQKYDFRRSLVRIRPTLTSQLRQTQMKSEKKPLQQTFLAAFLWSQLKAQTSLVGTCGEQITVIHTGERQSTNSLEFSSAEIIINGCMSTGEVVFGQRDCNNIGENSILQVITKDVKAVNSCKRGGQMIPMLAMSIDNALESLLEDLQSGSKQRHCAGFISSLEPVIYLHFMTQLLYERLECKYNEVIEEHEKADKNWNQTLHVMFFRAMGSPRNTKPFKELATRIPYDIFAHERESLEVIEALMYGGSGLLQTRSDRLGYIKTLRLHFSHLGAKYNITPLRARAWVQNQSTANGKPVTRLMQTASFLHNNNLLFNKLIETTKVEQIYELFKGETSVFWRDDEDIPQKIGKDRQEVLAINQLVPVKFTYAKCIDDEDMAENAVDMLYKLPAERNGIVNSWRAAGLKPKDSAETQALIQLSNAYCSDKRCAECRFGREQIRIKYASLSK